MLRPFWLVDTFHTMTTAHQVEPCAAYRLQRKAASPLTHRRTLPEMAR